MWQKYGGKENVRKHFEYLLRAFSDPRYITVDDKPMFQILSPSDLPDMLEMTDTLRELAHKNGLSGLYLIAGYRAAIGWGPREGGFVAAVSSHFNSGLRSDNKMRLRWLVNRWLHMKRFSASRKLQRLFKRYYRVFDYAATTRNFQPTRHYDYEYYPVAIPNWDNTPRSGTRGHVLTDSTPEKFKKHLAEAIEYVQVYEPEHRIVFIKSWNEWAEGNYLEPDARFGMEYLEALKDSLEADI